MHIPPSTTCLWLKIPPPPKKKQAPIAFGQHNKQPLLKIRIKLKAWADWRAVAFTTSGQSTCTFFFCFFLICLPSVYFIAFHDWYESFIEIHSAGSQSRRTDVPTETWARLRGCPHVLDTEILMWGVGNVISPIMAGNVLVSGCTKACLSATGLHARAVHLITARRV